MRRSFGLTTVEIAHDEVSISLQRPSSDESVEGIEGIETGRSPSEWRLAIPLEARADGAAVTSLIEELIALRADRAIVDYSPAELGLDQPRATVTLAPAATTVA